MAPEVRYARSGELRIAYQVLGSTANDLVWTSGASSHLDLMWEEPHFVRLFERVAQFTRLIIFDKRGTGLSDRTDHLATLEERIDDIRAVMDASGSATANVIGISEGGAMAALFAATYPQRTRSLILYGTPLRYSWAPDWPWGTTDDAFEENLRNRNARNWAPDFADPAWRKWVGAGLRDDPAFMEWWGRYNRSGGSPAAREALARMNRLIDVRDVLPTIRVPTLIINREDDPLVPLPQAKEIAARIPQARLVILPGEGHFAFDVWEQLVAAIEEFVTGAVAAVPHDRFLATLSAIDVVGSTELLARIGDDAWRGVLARYYALVARELAVHGGVEVDRAGDGFLARFDGPARAIRFSQAAARDSHTIGLRVRAGVHTGEVEVEHGAVRGVAVHMASRIAALAKADEVLVSNTVRDLAEGGGFIFADRGLHELRGLSERRQLFAIA